MTKRTIVALCVSAILTAWAGPYASAQSRTVLDVEWTLVGTTPVDFDSPLQYPTLLAASADLVATFDMAGNEVFGLHPDGRVAWRRGGSGQGPQEFSHVTDLEVTGAGVWVADRGNGRVSSLDAHGEWRSLFRVPTVYQIGVASDGRILATSDEPFVGLYSQSGELLASAALPTHIGERHFLARDPILSSVSTAGTALLVFRYLADPVLIRVGRSSLELVERAGPVKLPDQDVIYKRTPNGAVAIMTPEVDYHRSVAVNDEEFVVLVGQDDGVSTLVDRYDLDGFYLSSLELPEAVNRLSSVDGHRVAALIHEPIPHIKVWEWKAPG